MCLSTRTAVKKAIAPFPLPPCALWFLASTGTGLAFLLRTLTCAIICFFLSLINCADSSEVPVRVLGRSGHDPPEAPGIPTTKPLAERRLRPCSRRPSMTEEMRLIWVYSNISERVKYSCLARGRRSARQCCLRLLNSARDFRGATVHTHAGAMSGSISLFSCPSSHYLAP